MTATAVPAAFLAPTTVRSRQRAGRGLLTFGVVGLVLLALAGFLVLGSLGALASAAAELDAQRVQLVALLPPAEEALDGAAESAANAGTSLQASAHAARDAADLLSQLAQAMDGMSSAAQIEVFGLRPFEAISDDMAGVASRSRTLATDLVTTAGALDRNVFDSRAAATDLRALADELAILRTELAADALSGDAATNAAAAKSSIVLARIVLLGLLLWLAVPALLATWLGWRWMRG